MIVIYMPDLYAYLARPYNRLRTAGRTAGGAVMMTAMTARQSRPDEITRWWACIVMGAAWDIVISGAGDVREERVRVRRGEEKSKLNMHAGFISARRDAVDPFT